MAPTPPRSGGGWHAIGYTLRKAREGGGFLRMYQAMRSKNACKTCALGMGGQLGGMVNELGHFPEFCKKSIQAMGSDLQPAIPAHLIEQARFDYLGGLSPRQLETMGRLVTPLVAEAGSDHYRSVSWESAMVRLADKLRGTPPDQSFFYFSGRSSNEAGFLLQLLARIFGTNNVNNCSFYCHQASGIGLSGALGVSTGSVALEDLDQSDMIILIGGNPASNHPRFMRTLMDLKRRGGRVVVVNPLREVGLVNFKVPSDPRSLLFGSAIADIYVQPHIGGDIAFLALLAKAVVARNGLDRRYLSEHTSGSEEFLASLASLGQARLQEQSGVPAEVVDSVCTAYLASRATIFSWAMGITHHLHGVDNVRMIANLALLRGMCGRAGAGLLPLRGHSNIQGLGTVGVTPRLKQQVFAALEKRFGISLPSTPGLDTMQSMERAAAGGIRTAWCLGGNLYGSNPDASYAQRALSQIDQVVYLNTTLNTGHIHGRGKETWILPVLARDEEPEQTTQESMFSYVRLSDGGVVRHQGPRSEVQVIAGLGRAVFGDSTPIDWKGLERHGAIRDVISAVIPGLEQLATIDQTKKEFHISGRAYHDPDFKTSDHRAHVQPVALPSPPALEADQLRMMTIRSEGQFNTVGYEDYDRYRGQERRDVILMHAADRQRLGLSIDQRVTITSSAGSMSNILVREADIRPGNAAMYYPEANVLVPRAVDRESGTPSFKHVVVRVHGAT